MLLEFNCYNDIQYYYDYELKNNPEQRAFKLPFHTRYYNPKTLPLKFEHFLDFQQNFCQKSVYSFLRKNLGEFAFRHNDFFSRISPNHITENLRFYLSIFKLEIIHKSIYSIINTDEVDEIVNEAIDNRRSDLGYSSKKFIDIKYIQNPYYFENTAFTKRESFKSSYTSIRYDSSKKNEYAIIEQEIKDWDHNIKLSYQSLSQCSGINPRSIRRRMNESEDLKMLYNEVKKA